MALHLVAAGLCSWQGLKYETEGGMKWSSAEAALWHPSCGYCKAETLLRTCALLLAQQGDYQQDAPDN